MKLIGLTNQVAAQYQHEHGYNEIIERKDSIFKRIWAKSFTLVSGMLLLASLLSLVSGKLFDCIFIFILLILNVGVTIWQENKADTAIEKLNQHLATSIKVLRDGSWKMLASRELVPHDFVSLRSGDIVPADAKIIEANNLNANEAALTGESLPKEKNVGDLLYSGSFIASGLVTAEIIATGNSTQFGKTLVQVDTSKKKSSLEQDILRISRFLSILSVVAVALISWILILRKAPLLEVLRLDLSLIIAGIPISLPTVMTLIIAFGTVALAKKGAIVRRLASLEELANADFLLTDKTGTLTENNIRVDEIISYGNISLDEVIKLAAWVAATEPDTDIEKAIIAKSGPVSIPLTDRYIPGDSIRKRSTLTIALEGSTETFSLGAPQIIEGLCNLSQEVRGRFEADVERFAHNGYRTIALARVGGRTENMMELIGLISLSDQLRGDAAASIQFLKDNGIGVTMVTGDNRAIAHEVADKLKIPGSNIMTRDELLEHGFDALTPAIFANTRAFAEILPEDKYKLVLAAKKFYTVASNGDGVNDLSAVKAADVGFAVKNAVDALKGAADIVLLTDGITVMSEAFLEGRKIFARLYSYSLYRISESFRLVVTIAILGLLTGSYPLSPLQLIILALLNDVPIISLATDRVKIAHRPSLINVREQFSTSILFGVVGVANSLLLYFIATNYLHLPLAVVQTLFFLKLTIGGHLLIYITHTRERWWRFLPSKTVIIATVTTQLIATIFAVSGFFMPAPISWKLALLVWIWAIFFMQISELVKYLKQSISKTTLDTTA